MRALVVDDEPLARRGIQQLFASHSKFCIAGACANGVEALRFLEREDVELLVLDIQMPVLSGFDVVRELIAIRGVATMPAVIFLTAYEEFAVEAFEVEA